MNHFQVLGWSSWRTPQEIFLNRFPWASSFPGFRLLSQDFWTYIFSTAWKHSNHPKIFRSIPSGDPFAGGRKSPDKKSPRNTNFTLPETHRNTCEHRLVQCKRKGKGSLPDCHPFFWGANLLLVVSGESVARIFMNFPCWDDWKFFPV